MKTKINEFKNLINDEKPKEISFSDEKDKPIKQIDTLLNEAIKRREQQLNVVLQNQNENTSDAEKWINLDENGKQNKLNKINKENKENNQNVNIKIGENIEKTQETEEIIENVNKSVTFVDENTNNFLSKLKVNVKEVSNENNFLKLLHENIEIIQENTKYGKKN